MRVCAISMKECWERPAEGWTSYGGFPCQMTAIASLFNEMDLLIVRSKPRAGGLPLPPAARIVAMREPKGVDARRKLDVLLHLPYYVSTMARYIREADVVHTPLPGDMPLLGLAIALVMRKPVIARYGGSWQATDQTTFMNRVTRTLMRVAARTSNVVIATGVDPGRPAKGMEWLFSTSLTNDEVRSIQPDLDRGLQVPVKLIYAGRLSVEKGVYELVRAVHLLRERRVRMPALTIAGDGRDRRGIVDLAKRLDCVRHIRFTGQLNREGLSAEFLNADIAVQPSLTESFGKAWIDAMVHVHSRILGAFVLLLALQLSITPDLAAGSQTILQVIAPFGILLYFARTGYDTAAIVWLGTINGVLGALGGFVYFLQLDSLPLMNKNAWSAFPLTALFCLCFSYLLAPRSMQMRLGWLAAVNTVWVFLSGSRGAMFIGIVCLVFLLVRTRSTEHRLVLFVVAPGMASLLLMLFSAVTDTSRCR